MPVGNDPFAAFVARWLEGEPATEATRQRMLAELRALIVDVDPATRALAAGYGLGELRAENQRLQAEIARLTDAGLRLAAKCANVEVDYSVLKVAHDGLHQEIADLREERQELRDGIALLQQRLGAPATSR